MTALGPKFSVKPMMLNTGAWNRVSNRNPRQWNFHEMVFAHGPMTSSMVDLAPAAWSVSLVVYW